MTRNFDMSRLAGDVNGSDDSLIAATFFASQGYVVIAPNYSGYAGSSLPYHAYLNANQAAAEMIDALRAAKLALPEMSVASDAQIFLTGYSEGGYVALATYREIQRNYRNDFHVAAVAPGAGPYALSQIVDSQIMGEVGAFSPMLFTLLATGWQASYHNIYKVANELYAAPYASSAPTLLPSDTPLSSLFSLGRLPQYALFQTGSLPGPDVSNPDLAAVALAGFSPMAFLVNTEYRNHLVADIAAQPCNGTDPVTFRPSCSPTTGLRKDALLNDLRTFVPSAPVQLCGAHSDSTVFFDSTLATQQYFLASGTSPSILRVIDVDPGQQPPAGPDAALQRQFLEARNQLRSSLGDAPDASLRLSLSIHSLAAPFCFVAARSLFDSLRLP
ncbi:alpha/beta hydrolase family protein [Burkholderia territorii]|uniref:alpha/beta hydrolase family protein n=1 Tax=Burkholderia territorii TaxID=1503055 RepID=UPI0018C66056|nr:lipase family protein [Burkholderia territorii]